MKKNCLLLTLIFLFFTFQISAQETISLDVSDGGGCSGTDVLNKGVIGAGGGYGFSGVSFRIDFTGTEWQLSSHSLGLIFSNPSTQTPFPPCLSDGGWVYVTNMTACLNQINNLSGDGCGAVMPVELISFNVIQKGKNALLEWQTATEVNNDYFEIQRSRDGKIFETIGYETGHGTTSESVNYSYEDQTVLHGTYYYRLKQVDFNGQYEFYNVAMIKLENQSIQFKVYPTVTNDIIQLEMNKSVSDKTINIYSSVGQLVETYQIEGEMQQYNLNFSHLSSGMYIIEMKNDEVIKTVRVMKE